LPLSHALGIISAILNDAVPDDLRKALPACNLIRYSPANLVLNMLDGTNVGKGDFLFAVRDWKVRDYYMEERK